MGKSIKEMVIATAAGLILGGSITAISLYSSKQRSPVTQMVFSNSVKTQPSKPVVKPDNSKIIKELNQYKQNESIYQDKIENLQYQIDSLEIVCANKTEAASELELYVAEFHTMNKRYGNLPYKIEKKISDYHSKE